MVNNVNVPIEQIPAALRPKPEGEVVQGQPITVAQTAWQTSGLVRSLWDPVGYVFKSMPNTFLTWTGGNPNIPIALEKVLDTLGVPCPGNFAPGAGDLVGSFIAIASFGAAMYAAIQKDIKGGVKNETIDSSGPSGFSKSDFQQPDGGTEQHTASG